MTGPALRVSAVLAAVPSSDLARSEAFYEALIGRPVEERPMPVLAQWRWDGGTLQVVEDSARAGGGLVSVVVPDMAEALAGMRHRGLDVSAEEGSVAAQAATLVDPDGIQVTVVEAR